MGKLQDHVAAMTARQLAAQAAAKAHGEALQNGTGVAAGPGAEHAPPVPSTATVAGR